MIYKGEFKNGTPNGIGSYYYDNGNRYKGQVKNGKKEGYGILYNYFEEDGWMGR